MGANAVSQETYYKTIGAQKCELVDTNSDVRGENEVNKRDRKRSTGSRSRTENHGTQQAHTTASPDSSPKCSRSL